MLTFFVYGICRKKLTMTFLENAWQTLSYDSVVEDFQGIVPFDKCHLKVIFLFQSKENVFVL